MASVLGFLRNHWKVISFLVPLVVFFGLDSFFSYDVAKTDERPSGIDASPYLWLVIARVFCMMTLIAVFWRSYICDFELHVDRWGILVGLLGAAVWIGLCELGIEKRLVSAIGFPDLLGERVGANPFKMYADHGLLMTFLFFRFTLLVVAVPIAEELFLRAFFMRAVDAVEWQELPLDKISMTGLVAGTGYGMLSHPSEFIAAAIWFTMVSILMVRTNRFWNCVVAHAVTNFILGIYICATDSWYLW